MEVTAHAQSVFDGCKARGEELEALLYLHYKSKSSGPLTERLALGGADGEVAVCKFKDQLCDSICFNFVRNATCEARGC